MNKKQLELHKKITEKMQVTHKREFRTKGIGKYCEYIPNHFNYQEAFAWKYADNIWTLSNSESKLSGLVSENIICKGTIYKLGE